MLLKSVQLYLSLQLRTKRFPIYEVSTYKTGRLGVFEVNPIFQSFQFWLWLNLLENHKALNSNYFLLYKDDHVNTTLSLESSAKLSANSKIQVIFLFFFKIMLSQQFLVIPHWS